jgi:HAMP domain-containing protein
MNAILEWTSTHRATTTLVVLPIIGAVLNFVFKSRTTEELSRLPRWAQLALTTLRTMFPDPAPLLSVLAAILLRRPDIETLPGIESLPPPPALPKVIVIRSKEDAP